MRGHGGYRELLDDRQRPVMTDFDSGATSFSCVTGPIISLTRIANTAVTFSEAGVPVTITNGSSATVGPYQITVLRIDAGTAVFEVGHAG
jgi:hypothetical protein